MTQQPRNIIHVTTVGATVRAFLVGHIRYALSRGARVEVVCGKDEYVQDLGAEIGVPVHDLPLKRAISPLHDLVAVYNLMRLFRRLRPTVVHAHTPKGGLIGMSAAFLARVPCRVYTVHGLVHVTKHGWKRKLMMATEFISCRLAHRVLCVSNSMRSILIEDRLAQKRKCEVVAHGSICGVDTAHFHRTPELLATAKAHRQRLGIPDDARVIGFIGRLVRDKGVVELSRAWAGLRESFPSLRLLLVGAYEDGDPVPDAVRDVFENDDRVHMAGWQTDVVPFLSMMDLLALPTYREGLPIVLLESSAMGVVPVSTRVPGCVDAVQDGVTGVLVEPRDAAALERACRELLSDEDKRRAMSEAAARFVKENFRPEPIFEGYFQEYVELCNKRGLK